jgi:acyl carrier protein
MKPVISALRDYIRAESGYEGDLDPDVDLLDANILDSFSIVQLAVFIQEQFGIELAPEDFTRTNLASLSSIVALIDRRKADAPRAC